MTDRESMEFSDFRVVTSSSVYRKGSTASGLISSGGQSNRCRYTLGEVSSTNITLDVNVGAGWTRIRLREVPKFIVHAFNMITKFGMEVDGIFRKEGNSARLNRAEVQNIYKGECDIPNDYTVIDVCTLVKRFLRDLKPPLLDSDEFRQRLLKKACQSRISNCFVLTRDEMADMSYSEHISRDWQESLLSDIHFSTLGYVMRQLSRIAAHSDQHKMSIENLAVVLVGSVFGDGIHTSKKSGQIRRGSQDDILAQKKQDMNVHVAAVKLLITNANLIGIRRDPYVTSGAGGPMPRSSSAMPRCSSGYETASSDADGNSIKTASILKSGDVQGHSTSSSIYRRDSEAAHKIVTARKKNDQMAKKKRSASFLPSFRDIRHRLTNMKRAKSPSPERLTTGHTSEQFKTTDTTSSSDQNCEPQHDLLHRKKVARNESSTMSTGSTASGRQSRSQQSRRGNTNAAPRMGSDHRSAKPTIAKLFETSDFASNVSNGALRRLSASDQNADAMRFARLRSSNEQISAAEFLMSEHEKEKHSRLQKRNTMVLGENAKSSSVKHTNRRHTAPINNNRLRRNRPNTVGAGLPHQKKETLITSSSMEEKENHADCETDDTVEQAILLDQSEMLLEQKAIEARSRRAGRKQQKTTVRTVSTESMMVLNGSMATEMVASSSKKEVLGAVKEESPKKAPEQVTLRKDIEEMKQKHFCDMATSPMVIDTPKEMLTHENGHVWVGTKQVITVTPSPSLARRQSRARLSYSKATESPIDMPSRPRESSPLMSPVLKHMTVNNNSPPSQMITTSPRNSLTPKSHVLSPLVLKMEHTPPPIPPHSPPNFTPQTSRVSLEAAADLKRISLSGVEQRRRPPTPPSHPRLSNPFSPKLPIRSVTIDNGYELPVLEAPSGLFKLPQLPKKISATSSAQLCPPLTRQQQSVSTLSVPNRANLRETKSIDTADTAPLRSAPLTSSYHAGQMSPQSNDYFEFGKYTNILRSSKDEFALPSRKQCVDMRPSVAIIRNNNCGLVRSRVNHFQEIEQMQRNETSMSGRTSAMSQLSLKSNDTQPSSDRFSDVSDSRNILNSSESMDSPPTPTLTSRVSYDPVHHF
ncbi:unnamed protein product [Caenorhabditis sp. 36 PRJEB53466]|nr:unnamed protein product [Caenorhabditis sp. 36 PRJEB53466]